MKRKRNGLNGDNNGDHAYHVDLNDPKVQEKIVAYVRYGVAAMDSKHGHSAKLQCRATPIQADMLQALREKAPNGYWKTQSDQLRSIIAVGTYVSMRVLKEVEHIPHLAREFQVLDTINMISRRVREQELEVEARRAISELSANTFDIDKLFDFLKMNA